MSHADLAGDGAVELFGLGTGHGVSPFSVIEVPKSSFATTLIIGGERHAGTGCGDPVSLTVTTPVHRGRCETC